LSSFDVLCGLSDPHAAASACLLVFFTVTSCTALLSLPRVLSSSSVSIAFPSFTSLLLGFTCGCFRFSSFSCDVLLSMVLAPLCCSPVGIVGVSIVSGSSFAFLSFCLSHISRISLCPIADLSRNLLSASFTCGVTRSSHDLFCLIDIFIRDSIGIWNISRSRWATFISLAYNLSILAFTSFSAREIPLSSGDESSCRWLFLSVQNSRDLRTSHRLTFALQLPECSRFW
jgi:hypothetical protein